MLLPIIQPTIFEWASGFGLKSLRIEGREFPFAE
jgi:hypothetical protein